MRKNPLLNHGARSSGGRPGLLTAFFCAGWLVLLLVSRLLSDAYLAFDIVASVGYLFAIPLGIVSVMAVARQQWIAAAGLFITAIVSFGPLLFGRTAALSTQNSGPTASVLHCNIRGSVAAWESLRIEIENRKPDIITLVEASDALVAHILADVAIQRAYPSRVVPQPGLEWPQVVMSRHPIRFLPKPQQPLGTRLQSLFSTHRSIIVSLPIGDLIFSTEHVPSPRSSASWELGNAQIKALGDLVQNHYRDVQFPILITGDFNSTPSGYRDRLMRSQTRLLPDPVSLPPLGTWPSYLPTFLQLPLDRVWVSEEIEFVAREVLRDVGSDHRPVYWQFRNSLDFE